MSMTELEGYLSAFGKLNGKKTSRLPSRDKDGHTKRFISKRQKKGA